MEIYRAPQYLILHLKRFKSGRLYTVGSHYFEGGSSKINSFVSFPTENLDLTNYIVSNKVIKNDIKYDLFAVSNHYGGMGGGHYTAYAKNPIFKKWYEFNDSHASAAREQDVVSEAAYVLFYKLREIAQ
jgi:ubiquitin carboxyl-terminal hydrolase 4/11/15